MELWQWNFGNFNLWPRSIKSSVMSCYLHYFYMIFPISIYIWTDGEILVNTQIGLTKSRPPNKNIFCHFGDELASLLWYLIFTHIKSTLLNGCSRYRCNNGAEWRIVKYGGLTCYSCTQILQAWVYWQCWMHSFPSDNGLIEVEKNIR